MPLATSLQVIEAPPQTTAIFNDLGLSSYGERNYAVPSKVLENRRQHFSKAIALDEQELISACRARDRSAQRRMYDATVERVYRLILRMVRNPDDAFDLTQEVYIRVFTQIDQFRSESSLTTWLHRIAVNEALAFLRRKKTEDRHLNSPSNRGRLQQTDTQDSNQRLDIRAALDQLSDEDRLILLLRYDQGHDYRSIGEVLECAEGTVASRLNRARAKLGGLLSEAYSNREECDVLNHQKERRNRAGDDTLPDHGLALPRSPMEPADG